MPVDNAIKASLSSGVIDNVVARSGNCSAETKRRLSMAKRAPSGARQISERVNSPVAKSISRCQLSSVPLSNEKSSPFRKMSTPITSGRFTRSLISPFPAHREHDSRKLPYCENDADRLHIRGQIASPVRRPYRYRPAPGTALPPLCHHKNSHS